jgi:hypothetical protein
VTLLTICADVANEMGLDAQPVTIIGNTGVDELRLLRFANRVGRDLAGRASWQAMRRLQTFAATAAETQVSAIPADFARFYPETFWDRTNNAIITGPIDPTDYDSRRINASVTGYTGPMRWFMRRGNDMLVWPIPSGGESYAFEYQSNSFCQSALGVAQSAWTADTDTGVLDEELFTLGMVAFFLEADGQPSQMARATYERRLREAFGNDAPTGNVSSAGDIFGPGRHSTGEPGGARGWWW